MKIHLLVDLILLIGICNGLSVSLSAGQWEVLQETSIGAGYDSNLYGGSGDETEDGFSTLSHAVKVYRTNSLTRLEVDANVVGTYYYSEHDADFAEGGVAVGASYPYDAIDVSYWSSNAYWRRESNLDFDTGERIELARSEGLVRGEWFSTPKMSVVGEVRGTIIDRSIDGYGTSRMNRFRTGVGYEWRPELRLNLEYEFSAGHTDSGGGTDSTRQVVGLRARGRLMTKVHGDAFIGVRRATFEGAIDSTDTVPSFSADLKWSATPRLGLSLGVDNDYQFTAVGSVTLETDIALRIQYELGRGFRYTTFAERGISSYKYNSVEREDRSWTFGGEFEYSFTDRLFIQLSLDWISNRSSVEGRDLTQSLVSLQGGFRY